MAVDLYKGKIPIVYKSLNEGFIRGAPSEEPSLGCVPRDFDIDPVEMRDSPTEMTLIETSEYDARFDEAEATESSLEHMYLRGSEAAFQLLDQGKFPDCWAHSTGHCMMFARLRDNLPVLRFNAVAVATMLGRTNGGWAGLSMKFAQSDGYPIMGTGPGEWPQWTRNKKYDTPELRAAMAAHKADETWYDLGRKEYNQVLTRRQLDTCGFDNIPIAADHNRAGHSMCQLRRVRIEAGHWGDLTLNSWEGFGYRGLCVLAGWTATNAVALRTTTPSGK